MTREREYDFGGDDDSTSATTLELDRTSHLPVRSKTQRFVSGIPASEMTECIYCNAERPAHAGCRNCGYDADASVPPPSRYSYGASTTAPSTDSMIGRTETVFELAVDTIGVVPFWIWKRVPTYAFLALVIGNALLCGGLSGRTNVALVVLIILGVAGMAASARRGVTV